MSTNEKLVPGMVLGRYELLVPIAQGGMATVWAARQRGTRGFNKTVAIKTMLPALSDDPQFEQMFLDEAALAAKIHHPNVAEILDLGEQDEILYIVMEWIDGEAVSVLSKALRKNRAQVPLRLALRICHQAAAALHAAHELRDENDTHLHLVHRDVSPQNILVTYDGIVKLVDFGVAKAVGRAGGETTAGQLKGKVPYMSPEQARGGAIDRRTDIFALGIVLYKLTTDQHPFMGENDLATMRNIISRPVLPPRVKNPGFSKDVEQILIKCLQKDPEKRYQTMNELAQALERTLAGLGIADDDLGAFVRSTMGDRGAKRRAEIREAVRVADERYATGTHALVALPARPLTTHEHVSDAVLTKMSSGTKHEPISDRAILSVENAAPFPLGGPDSGRTPPVDTPPPSSASFSSGDLRPSSYSGGDLRISDPQSATHQAVMVAAEGPRRGRRPGVILVAVGAVAAAILGFVIVLRPAKPQHSPPPLPTAVVAAQPPPQAPDPTPPAPVPAPTPTAQAAPTASETAAAPTASEAAVAPTASVAASPAGAKPHGRGAGAPPAQVKPASTGGTPAANLGGGKIYTNPDF